MGGTRREQTGLPDQINPLSATQALPSSLRVPGPPEEEGLKFGFFQLYPDINIGATYDTNIFATRNGEVRDWLWSVSPSLLARAEFNRYRIDLRAGLESDRYQSNTKQDTNDHWVDGQLVYQLTGSTNIYGGVGHSRNHEDRGSPNLRFGSEPTVYYNDNAFAGMFSEWGRAYVRFGVAGSQLSFDDVATSTPGVTLVNQDRDRNTSGVGGRIGYKITNTTDIFFQGTTDRRTYKNVPDDAGYFRSSSGYRADIGSAFNFSDRVVGEAFIGQLKQDYRDPRFSTVYATDLGGSLRWHTSAWTTYKLALDRTLEESVIPDASSYLATTVTAGVEHDLAENTLMTGSVSLGRNKFHDIDRTDEYREASVGIRHYLDSSVYLRADMTAMQRNSGDPEANYSRNLFSVAIGTDFGARRRNRYFAYEARDDRLNLTNARNDYSGIYFGAALGLGTLTSTASGLRDATPGNTDIGEMGHTTTAPQLFAGIGKTFNQWYVGLEASFSQADDEIAHAHTNPTEPLYYTIRPKDSLAVDLRGGYVLSSGSLIYASIGAARATFDNTMVNVDGSFDQTFHKYGDRLGVGAETTLGSNMFWRIGYTFTKYDAYHMVSTQYDEQYRNEIGLFSMGLGWHLGGSTQVLPTVDPKILRGLYAGGQIGHGSLTSVLNAPVHYHASGNDTLVADFGVQDISGSVFLGYGHTIGRWYLGLEAELAPSSTTWSHERTTSGAGGRDFSVNKRGEYDFDLRAGYILENGSLIFARAGTARAKFNTLYQRGASGLIDREDTMNAPRFGVGAELPINKVAFCRMDFITTDFGSTPLFSSPGGTPDTLQFSNKENVFRVGLGARF